MLGTSPTRTASPSLRSLRVSRAIAGGVLVGSMLALIACGGQPSDAAPAVRPEAAAVPAVATPAPAAPVVSITPVAAPAAIPAVSPVAQPVVIAGFAKPFTYSFLAWQNKVQNVGGHAVLKGFGSKGGAGIIAQLPLDGRSDWSPALRLRVGAANTAKAIAFRLSDRNDLLAGWTFELPAPGSEFTVVLPEHSAPLSKPNRVQDKQGNQVPAGVPSFILAEQKGWQLIGDWQPGELDVEIAEVLAVPPDAAMRAARAAAVAAEGDVAERERQQRSAESARLIRDREDLKRRYHAGVPSAPAVVQTTTAAPDLITVVIEAQQVVPPTAGRYEAKPGDEKRLEPAHADRAFPMAKLLRDGQEIGWLQGRDLDYFSGFESIAGDPLLEFLADDAANYLVSSSDDPAYATPQHPAQIFRKSVPTDWISPANVYPTRHRLYLQMAQALVPGKTYSVAIDQVNVRTPEVHFTCDPRSQRSEAVHVNQIGFRPDDPAKRAFLSLWRGSGGAQTYPAGLHFSVIDEVDGSVAFSGPVELALAADGQELLAGKEVANSSKTAVYRMDFAGLTKPGRYRVAVDGVGCSYPFSIVADVWEKAFLMQLRGLFNNRCGIALGAPYTTFNKPRDFHPADGTRVTRSKYDVLAKGDFAYDEIAKGDTGEVVPDAWGGYHDAGDWNPRRVSHMVVTMAQLELVEMYPDYFNARKLNIPPQEGLPDILTEALFEIDCFRRIQQADGGMPFGMETDGDPLPGEISWVSSQHVFVPAANIRDSWFYAAVAARAAKLVKPFKPELAAQYQDSAIRAFTWAEADYAKRKADGSLAKLQEVWRATDNRNLAALVLYDLTADKKWHELFLQDTRLTSPDLELCWYGKWIQTDAAFLYGRLDDTKADPVLKANAIKAVCKQADKSTDFASKNAFSVTNKDKWRPVFCGFYSTPGGMEQARAHFLTGKREYLEGALRSCLFGAGCNPNNLVYTTGLGANPVRHPLHVDSRNTGQPAPEGLTVFGNLDYWNNKGGFYDWPVQYLNRPSVTWPDAYQWPLTEAYFDIHLFVSQNEFVVDTWAPNVFVWGYLAARKPVQ